MPRNIRSLPLCPFLCQTLWLYKYDLTLRRQSSILCHWVGTEKDPITSMPVQTKPDKGYTVVSTTVQSDGASSWPVSRTRLAGFLFFFVIRQTAFGLIWNSADFVGSGRYTPIALLFKFIIHFYTFCLVLKQREWPGELHYTYVLYARLGGVSLIRTRVRPYLFSSLHLTITLACAATSDHSSRYFCDLHH